MDRTLSRRFLLWAVLTAIAQAERPTIHTLTTEQGLVSNGGVLSIRQDSQGFLWFGTHEGLSRFDGTSFRNYGVAQGLSAPPQIYKVLITSTDDLWVTRDTARYDARAPEERRFRSISFGKTGALPANLLEDHAGTIWAIANGLYRNRDPVHSDTFERVCLGGAAASCADSDSFGDTLLEGDDQSLWIARQSNGLMRRLPSGAVQRFGAREGLPYPVLSLLRDRNRRIWAGTTHGLVRLVATPFPGRSVVDRAFRARLMFPPCAVNDLVQSRDGHLWAATRCGLVEVDGSRVRTYTVADGLSQDVIDSVFEDRDGELWLGTESAGVMRVERKGTSAFGSEAGLEQEVIDGTLLDHRGRIVVIRNRAGHLVLRTGDRSGFRPLFPPMPLQPTDLGFQHWQVALEDHEGKWWIPGTNQIKVLQPTRSASSFARATQVFDKRSGLPAGRIDCMLEDHLGNIWFGLYSPPHSTLVEWLRSTGHFRSWEGTAGVPADRVPVALSETRSGSIWIAYARGDLGRYRDGRHLLLPAGPGFGTTIMAVHEDDAGRLWTGRRNSEFYQVQDPDGDNPTLRRIANVAAPFLRCILNDAQNRLYLASEAGLIQYDPSTGAVRHFHEHDGLPSDVLQNGVRDRSGTLWFGTGRGLVRFEPPQAGLDAPPRVWLDRITVGGEVNHRLSDRGESNLDNVRLTDSFGTLRIDFNSISFTSDIRFQYRLDPGDPAWSAPDAERSVTYARLRAGTYRFSVRALDAAGRRSQPATLSFAVLPPFWRRPWFVALVALTVALLFSLLYRSRVLRLLQIERLRLRIASDLHDDLGATLTQIAVLSENLRSDDSFHKEPAEDLRRIAETAREMTSSLGDVVWSISPERDQLSDLLSRMRRLGNDLCDANDIDFELHATSDATVLALAGHIRHQLFLIFKEALHNAVRHSGCRRYSVSCAAEERGLSFTFHDDGVGLDPDQQSNGFGVPSMHRRATSIGGECHIRASRTDGTTIEIVVPDLRHRTQRPAKNSNFVARGSAEMQRGSGSAPD